MHMLGLPSAGLDHNLEHPQSGRLKKDSVRRWSGDDPFKLFRPRPHRVHSSRCARRIGAIVVPWFACQRASWSPRRDACLRSKTRRLRPPAQDARLTRREYARRRNGRPQSYAHAGASRAGGSSPSRPQRAWTSRRPGASGLTTTSMTATITIVSKRPTRSARPRNPSTSGGSPLRQSGQASVVRLKMRIVDLDVPLPAPDRAPRVSSSFFARGGAGRGAATTNATAASNRIQARRDTRNSGWRHERHRDLQGAPMLKRASRARQQRVK